MRQARPDSTPPMPEACLRHDGEGLGLGVNCTGNADGEIAAVGRTRHNSFPSCSHPTRLDARKARLATLPVKGRVLGLRALDS
jgi:hypothetical protein